MSDQNAETTETAPDAVLDTLKQQATDMGIKWHTNIKAPTLIGKIAEFLSSQGGVPTPAPAVKAQVVPLNPAMEKVKVEAQLVKAATKLVRVKIACMNPDKKEWKGELFSVSNSVVPTQKKYVPFNNEAGWHIPQIIFNMIKERKCQTFKTVKGPHGDTKESVLISEFSIDIMDPLTAIEIEDLKTAQAVANNLG